MPSLKNYLILGSVSLMMHGAVHAQTASADVDTAETSIGFCGKEDAGYWQICSNYLNEAEEVIGVETSGRFGNKGEHIILSKSDGEWALNVRAKKRVFLDNYGPNDTTTEIREISRDIDSAKAESVKAVLLANFATDSEATRDATDRTICLHGTSRKAIVKDSEGARIVDNLPCSDSTPVDGLRERLITFAAEIDPEMQPYLPVPAAEVASD